MSHSNFINQYFKNSAETILQQGTVVSDKIEKAAVTQAKCLHQGNKILIAGNGGSAADSLHYSSELLNKYKKVRAPLAGISLTADTTTLTSISNDEEFNAVFSKQVTALGKVGDILVLITSSGNSENLCRAARAAHDLGMRCIALNGRDGGVLSQTLNEEDIDIVIEHSLTSHIQEVHGIIIHLFCDLIDQILFPEN